MTYFVNFVHSVKECWGCKCVLKRFSIGYFDDYIGGTGSVPSIGQTTDDTEVVPPGRKHTGLFWEDHITQNFISFRSCQHPLPVFSLNHNRNHNRNRNRNRNPSFFCN